MATSRQNVRVPIRIQPPADVSTVLVGGLDDQFEGPVSLAIGMKALDAEALPMQGFGDVDEVEIKSREIFTANVGASGGIGYNPGDTVEATGGTPGSSRGFMTVSTVASGPPGPIATLINTDGGNWIVDPAPLTDNPVNTLTGGGSGALVDLTMSDI
jgi:hypothetical protein